MSGVDSRCREVLIPNPRLAVMAIGWLLDCRERMMLPGRGTSESKMPISSNRRARFGKDLKRCG